MTGFEPQTNWATTTAQVNCSLCNNILAVKLNFHTNLLNLASDNHYVGTRTISE